MIQNVILGGLLVIILGVLILILKRLSEVKHQAENAGQDTLDLFREDISRSEHGIKEELRSTERFIDTSLTTRLESVGITISERLEALHQTAGTMQNLATEVGDVKKILANVSLRGIFGEAQLEAILKQFLTPDQYAKNVQPNVGSERVEFAIRLPGNNEDINSCVWLPIDSKFPIADYQRILDAVEKADKDIEKKAVRGFVQRVRSEAKRINEKYISPPNTTEFAIMFLPTEGLYAEVLRQPGQVEDLLQNYRIIVAGPVNLAAIIMSLRVGFNTLAIQKHSRKIQDMFSAIKTEFGTFNNVLRLTQKHLGNASNALKKTEERSHAVVGKLREVQDLSPEEAAKTLELPEFEIENESSEE